MQTNLAVEEMEFSLREQRKEYHPVNDIAPRDYRNKLKRLKKKKEIFLRVNNDRYCTGKFTWEWYRITNFSKILKSKLLLDVEIKTRSACACNK